MESFEGMCSRILCTKERTPKSRRDRRRTGFYLRWGGSWDGWKVKKDGTGLWRGEAIEAGYVTENRVYNNVFYGYDNGCITTPRETQCKRSSTLPLWKRPIPPDNTI